MEGQTLHAVLDKVAADHPETALEFRDRAERTELTLAQLSADSRLLAGRLRRLGVGSGDRVASLCMNEPDFLVLLFAVGRLGACLCPLSVPTRSVEAFAAKARAILADGAIRDVVLSTRLAGMEPLLVEPLAGYRRISLAEQWPQARAEGAQESGAEVDPRLDAVLQYTSGSTSHPKGVRLSHDNILACLEAIRAGIDLTPADRHGVWLPLFHDMGLFGTLAGTLTGVPSTVWQPSAFIKDPAGWLREFAEGRHTISALPNFAYDYLVQAVSAAQAPEYDLSVWRVAFNGAEQIAQDSVAAFLERFAPAGFRAGSLFPVYGLAEATLAATFPPPGRRPAFDWVDRFELTRSGRAVPVERTASGARAVASVGRPVLGMDLRIADPESGRLLGERRVGEVQLRGVSVTAGYATAAKAAKASDEAADEAADGATVEPAVTQPFTADGWLRTGDLGYLYGAELHVTGRLKEMLLLRGENYYPDDVESAVRTDPSVHRRRCVAFVHEHGDGRERMVLCAETDRPAQEHAEIAARLRHRVQAATGLPDLAVVLAPRGSIPRTTSGKLRRLEVRRDYAAAADGLDEGARLAHA